MADNTPAARTGPPRSVSFATASPSFPAHSEDREDQEFRGALEYASYRKSKYRRVKERASAEEWNPKIWLHEYPVDETQAMDSPLPEPELTNNDLETPPHSPAIIRNSTASYIRRAFSAPHNITQTPSDKGKQKEEDKEQEKDTSHGSAKWTKLRSLLPHIAYHNQPVVPDPSVITSHTVNITDELITGGLSTLMLRLWLDRDEKGRRRVPVLLHRLRIRVSDSIHPLQQQHSVFRIECEYANGAARWVIYRELRDFVSLHAHYTVSNVYNRIREELPEFPLTSLPYLKFLKKGGARVSSADFARMQRETLENYLIDLIRTVMFHPSSNRLAGFLEISALSITLAQSGGAQSKAGYLRIVSSEGGFGRKAANLKAKKEVWCAVRESYLVVLEEPGELDVWEVFLIDHGFQIERPKRYYRTWLKYEKDNDNLFFDLPQTPQVPEILPSPNSEKRSVMSSIRTQVSKILHSDPLSDVQHEHEDDVRSDSASSVVSSAPSRVPTVMLDPSTNKNPLQQAVYDEHGEDVNTTQKEVPKDVSKHTFYVLNSQMKLKISARNERQMMQFITALEKTAATCNYSKLNRFGSFAPPRHKVAAQWLVDGRDYFWNLSRAILLAKESIYIHDWWLSPELEMRRPNKERYRLDKLLERKAKEGVKIYVIIYLEVSNRTTPVDSNYTKQKLVDLHPNVMVQRSPSHFQTGTFYWAHHEKMCVIDQTIAFMGGLDLCFGRWDTPQHVLIDDTADTDRAKIWPGKDYSNPRVLDFFNLHKPEEDMYDRTKVPRMPWHDVGMQIIGQPARDLARHFVQRWNYLLRIKNHSRVMPFLLPPPEFRPGELSQLGLTGTCELQICRSAGPWSLGTPDRIEHSIQNAYLKAIEMSEHFVYIENQFFITSTVVKDVKVENRIGDAIVHRIIRAHRQKTPWKCCIIIPLLPGFTFPIDHPDASAIRIILECQNFTISRGPNSIFSRLKEEGIDPDEYISVFSLRNWAKMRGNILTTEQVYIHGKCCIVDDRLAIIGSANINERSQRGDRDSELAAIIKDTDMIDRTMAGRPFKVGRFAHTLRVRLMREHLGIDVDALSEENIMAHQPKPEYQQQPLEPEPDLEQEGGNEGGVFNLKKSKQKTPIGVSPLKVNQNPRAGEESISAEKGKNFRHETHETTASNEGDRTLGEEDFNEKGQKITGIPSSVVRLLQKEINEKHPPKDEKDEAMMKDQTIMEESESVSVHSGLVNDGPHEPSTVDSGTPAKRKSPSLRGDVDSEDATASTRGTLRTNLGSRSGRKPWTVPTMKPKVGPQDFEDPILDDFWKDIWVASAIHNAEIYRKVFHAVPDDLITTWKQYKDFVAYQERFNKPSRDSSPAEPISQNASESGEERAAPESQPAEPHNMNSEFSKDGRENALTDSPLQDVSIGTAQNEELHRDSSRRFSKNSEPFEKWEREEMEILLSQLNGQLVLYPNHFLEGENSANNFLFNADRLLPLPIYL